MSDYYNGINKVEDAQVKLQDQVCAWWDSLTEEEQHELMMDWYPADFTKDKYDDADSFFGDMPSSTQVWIWKRENHLTEEDIEGQRDRAGDIADGEYEYNKENRRGK